MTKAEICRAISEKLGWTCVKQVAHFWELKKPDGVLAPATACADPDGPWQFGPNYFESEDASARLRRFLASKDSLTMTYKTNITNGGILHVVVEIPWKGIKVADKDDKTAIVLAAMRWLGIEGELDVHAL